MRCCTREQKMGGVAQRHQYHKQPGRKIKTRMHKMAAMGNLLRAGPIVQDPLC